MKSIVIRRLFCEHWDHICDRTALEGKISEAHLISSSKDRSFVEHELLGSPILGRCSWFALTSVLCRVCSLFPKMGTPLKHQLTLISKITKISMLLVLFRHVFFSINRFHVISHSCPDGFKGVSGHDCGGIESESMRLRTTELILYPLDSLKSCRHVLQKRKTHHFFGVIFPVLLFLIHWWNLSTSCCGSSVKAAFRESPLFEQWPTGEQWSIVNFVLTSLAPQLCHGELQQVASLVPVTRKIQVLWWHHIKKVRASAMVSWYSY